MGWFFVTIVLPICVPLAFLLGTKLVDLPDPYASRAKLITVVQNGQLGWVAIVFAAACTYDLLLQIQTGTKAPEWAGPVFGISCVFLAISGLLATLGTLYVIDESKPRPVNLKSWVVQYRLFLATLVATTITAGLFSLVHYTLTTPCDAPPQRVDSR